MRRRRRLVWWLKWLGTLGCALLAAAFVVSLWQRPALAWDHRRCGERSYLKGLYVLRTCVWLGRGAIHIIPPGSDLEMLASPRPVGLFSVIDGFGPGEIAWTPDFDWPVYCVIPLWMPFAALLIPTLLCWRLDRRVIPGRCRKCRYDLTGNTSGRCPECGAAAPAPSSA